jgi:hypothetical protein
MVDQTYSPNKTVTLTDDKSNAINTPAPLTKKEISVKDNYLSHKTVILNPETTSKKKEEKPKVEPINNSTKPAVTESNLVSKDTEPFQKVTITPDTSSTEKTVEKPKIAQSNITTKSDISVINKVDPKIFYPTHKTFNLTIESPSENKEENPKIEPEITSTKPSTTINTGSEDTISSQKVTANPETSSAEKKVENTYSNQTNALTTSTTSDKNKIPVTAFYPSHKTVNLPIVSPSENKEEKTKIDYKGGESKTTSPDSNFISKENYSSPKTVNIDNSTTTIEKKEGQSSIIKNTSAHSVTNESTETYLSHKTIYLDDQKIIIQQEEKSVESIISGDTQTTITKETQTVVQSTFVNGANQNAIETSTELKVEVISKVDVESKDELKQQEIDKTAKLGNEGEKGNYPSSRTFIFKEEEKIPLNSLASKDSEEKQNNPTNIKKGSVESLIASPSTKSDYPDNKSYSFTKEENTTSSINDIGSSSVKKEVNQVPDKNKSQPTIVSPASKKPVLWISLSCALLILSSVAIWFLNSQQNSLKEEIALLKTNQETLTDSVMKLRRDKLHFDDIIIRAGKLNPKNNITLVENASESEVIRICFSINSNQYATIGKKALYIRFIGPDNNVLVKTKDNLFEYKGNKIPFSLMKEVDYNKGEMMFCFDYKLDKKLEKGIYKAELYNDGVLDLKSTLELK